MKLNFVSPIRSSMGYAEMARRTFPAFDKKFDVKAIEISMQTTGVDLGASSRLLESKVGAHVSPDLTIVNMVPILWNRYKDSSPLIGYTTFEADRLPKDWVDICNRTAGVLTTSEWNKLVMVASGVKVPVIALTPAFEERQQTPKNDGIFRFYSSFQWSKRKNPEGLLRAYIGAFEGKTDVELVIKTHIAGGDEQAQIGTMIKEIAGKTLASKIPRIRIVTGNISAAKNAALAAECQAYIGLSFAEGWGLPAWEAAELGRPTILTNWGAYGDWASGSRLLVESRTQPIYDMQKSVSPFFNSNMRWGDPSVSDAIDKLRWVAANYSTALNDANDLALLLRKKYNQKSQAESLEKIKL